MDPSVNKYLETILYPNPILKKANIPEHRDSHE